MVISQSSQHSEKKWLINFLYSVPPNSFPIYLVACSLVISSYDNDFIIFYRENSVFIQLIWLIEICFELFKNEFSIKVPRNKPKQGGKRPVLRKLHNTEERN